MKTTRGTNTKRKLVPFDRLWYKHQWLSDLVRNLVERAEEAIDASNLFSKMLQLQLSCRTIQCDCCVNTDSQGSTKEPSNQPVVEAKLVIHQSSQQQPSIIKTRTQAPSFIKQAIQKRSIKSISMVKLATLQTKTVQVNKQRSNSFLIKKFKSRSDVWSLEKQVQPVATCSRHKLEQQAGSGTSGHKAEASKLRIALQSERPEHRLLRPWQR